jgi:nitrate reductase NapD
VHITSLVVHVHPSLAAHADAVIASFAGARIHGSDAHGKRVVTLEAASAGEILDQVGAIQRAQGVLNVAMVYQHVESLESMNREFPHVDPT